ncbi:MAG: hypothetical protein JXR89_09930 [Deltaproteobacteria bacterium]|nr:hypothetical protein [Deltaproteobacteria bacterium]
MKVDFEVVCREGELGPMLAAAFLIRQGCRVMFLPPRCQRDSDPKFLFPVVRGCPARQLSALLPELSPPPAEIFSWKFVGREGAAGRLPELAGRGAAIFPSGAWAELDELYRVIDRLMVAGLEMPVASIAGIWRMLRTLITEQKLRENRGQTLRQWLAEFDQPVAEERLWSALTPLTALQRFVDPPLLAYAYGLRTLLAPEVWIDLRRLRERLVGDLLARGACRINEDWFPVFDGKWFIGVGAGQKASCRATVFLADADPGVLLREISPPQQRRDFRRQFLLEEPGFICRCEVADENAEPDGVGGYQLDCGPDFSKNLYSVPAETSTGKALYSFSPAACGWEWENGDHWGWQARLPAMMGAGFLPLQGSFRRFYQVGWHNLPGFGLGGLIYSAHRAAMTVLRKDLHRELG